MVRIRRLGDDGAYIFRDGCRDAARVRLVHRLRLLRVVGALVLLQGWLRQLEFRVAQMGRIGVFPPQTYHEVD